jgi:hypothetical protein
MKKKPCPFKFVGWFQGRGTSCRVRLTRISDGILLHRLVGRAGDYIFHEGWNLPGDVLWAGETEGLVLLELKKVHVPLPFCWKSGNTVVLHR